MFRHCLCDIPAIFLNTVSELMKFSRIFRFLLLVLGLTVGLSAVGQRRKIQNKPFIDTRRWHYGFNIGFHDQGLHLDGNGYTDEAGTQ